MIKIGITGSLASGKSTVAKLISRNKYPIFSADKVVKNLYKKNFFIKKVKSKFKLKNSKNIKIQVKNLIKKDKNKLQKLESIIHPLVRKEMNRSLKTKKNFNISIFEIPLLIEGKLTKYFDIILFVAANEKIRLRRYIQRGGNKKIFTILNKRQMSQKKKIKKSDFIIYNNRSVKNLKKRLDIILKRLWAKFF